MMNVIAHIFFVLGHNLVDYSLSVVAVMNTPVHRCLAAALVL